MVLLAKKLLLVHRDGQAPGEILDNQLTNTYKLLDVMQLMH